MSYELFIAKRYLKSKRKTGFISLITYISITGVMIGVAALIIVLSVMNGFESEVRSRIIGFDSHIEVKTEHDNGVSEPLRIANGLKHIEGIVGISPYIDEKALIISKKRKQGVAIKGVDEATLDKVSNIRLKVNYGVFDIGRIEDDNGRSYPGIVLGSYLADKLGADLGDKVQVLSPTGITSFVASVPLLRTFKVTGFFETGIFEHDDFFAYLAISEAQKLFSLGDKVTGLDVMLNDLDDAPLVAEQIHARLGAPYTAVTWFDLNKNLFSAMQIEKWGMFIALSLIIMVAAFNIISTLIMVVLEKTKEISILKSMGASSKSIMKIFIFEGLIGGLIGTVLGCALGVFVCWLQIKYKLISLPHDVYIISALPVSMNPWDVIFIVAVAISLCYLAAVYPARKAAILDPVEAMRYE